MEEEFVNSLWFGHAKFLKQQKDGVSLLRYNNNNKKKFFACW